MHLLLCFHKFFMSEVNLAKGNSSQLFFFFLEKIRNICSFLTADYLRLEGITAGVLVVYTHRLAHARVSSLIYATDKDPAGEGDVEAEVDQHVPKLAAHADGPEVTETTHHRIKTEEKSVEEAFDTDLHRGSFVFIPIFSITSRMTIGF